MALIKKIKERIDLYVDGRVATLNKPLLEAGKITGELCTDILKNLTSINNSLMYIMVFANSKNLNGDKIIIQVCALGDIDKTYEIAKDVMKKHGLEPSEYTCVHSGSTPFSFGAYQFTKISVESSQKLSLEKYDVPEKLSNSKIEDYINNLAYARDHFAETPTEKDVMERVINNIKHKNGRK